MAYSRPGYRRTGSTKTSSGKSSGRYVQPRVKLSLLGKAYNKVRWFCYFLPIGGYAIMFYGLYLALNDPTERLMVSQTVLAAGAIMTYLAIYYNKRT